MSWRRDYGRWLRGEGGTVDGAGQASSDGVRVARLLIAKLRFERICQGSARAGAWFERDPEGFVAAFRRFDAAVPPTAFTAGEAGAAFERWLQDS